MKNGIMDQANTQLNTEGSVMWKIKCTLFALMGFKKGMFTSCCCCRWFISKCEHIYKSRCFGNLLVWSIHGCVNTMTQSSQGWTAANLPQNGRKRKESMQSKSSDLTETPWWDVKRAVHKIMLTILDGRTLNLIFFYILTFYLLKDKYFPYD